MNENVAVDRPVQKITGTVKIEKVDAVTGKTGERHLGRNHVFENSFKCTGWMQSLSNVSRPVFFITDDITPPDDSFPYLRGNIQLFGQINAGAEGLHRGTWSTANSFVNVDSSIPPDLETGEPSTAPPGTGRIWRYQFEFGEAQLFSHTLGCIGITAQYRPVYSQTSTTADVLSLRPVRERFARGWGVQTLNVPGVVRNNKRYSIEQTTSAAAGTVVVTIYDMVLHTSRRVDVSRFFTALGATQQRSVGVAFDSEKAYLTMASATAAQRRVFEFEDDSFENLLHTANTTNIAATGAGTFLIYTGTGTTASTGGGFAVLGDEMYGSSNSGLAVANFRTNTNWAVRTDLAGCVYNGTASLGTRFVTIEDGIFYTFGMPGTAAGRYGVFEVPGGKQVATIAPFTFGGQFLGVMREPSLEGTQFLYIGSNVAAPGTGMEHFTNSALAAYVVPEGLREAEPGYAKRFTYQIEVVY